MVADPRLAEGAVKGDQMAVDRDVHFLPVSSFKFQVSSHPQAGTRVSSFESPAHHPLRGYPYPSFESPAYHPLRGYPYPSFESPAYHPLRGYPYPSFESPAYAGTRVST